MATRVLPAPSTALARAWAAVRAAYAWTVARPPWLVLSMLAVVQWLALVGLVLSIRHDGWLFYQGGDQTFYYSGAWGIAGGHLPPGSVGYGWTLLLAPIALFAGPSYLAALPGVVLLQVLVLLPLGLFFAYGIGERIAGRWLGYVTAVGWVAAPYLVIPGFVHRYHEQWVEQFLPQALGLTGLSDFFATVVTAGAAWFFLRYLDSRGSGDAVLAGLLTGLSIGIKPADVLFVAGPALALIAARRWRGAVPYAAGILPGVLALAVWKERGLGHLPILQSLGVHAVGGGLASIAPAITLPGSFHVSWSHLGENMAQFREFFWSMRLVEWLPFAGLVAVLRVSRPKALLLGGWLAAFVVVKATSPRANVPDGTFFRLMMPAWPAYLALGCALPLLVPDVARAARNAVAAAPVPRPIAWRSRPVVVTAILAGLVPLVVVGVLPRLQSRTIATDFHYNTIVPVGLDLGLRASVQADGVHLSWRPPPRGSTSVFYRVYASPTVMPPPNSARGNVIDGVACVRDPRPPRTCSVESTPLNPTRLRTFVVPRRVLGSQKEWSFRVGVLANWVKDPTAGDDLMLSSAVRVRVGA